MTERFYQNSVGHPSCRLLRFFLNLLFSPEEVEALRGPLPSAGKGLMVGLLLIRGMQSV